MVETAGTLTAEAFARYAVPPALAGAGVVTATATASYARTASLAGSGTLAAPSTALYSQSATLSGAGTLSAIAEPALISFNRDAALSGLGLLAPTTSQIYALTSAHTGAGTLTATRSPIYTFPVATAGAGTLSATASPVAAGAVAWDKTSDLGMSFGTATDTVTDTCNIAAGGANRAVILVVYLQVSASATGDYTTYTSSATCGGVAMTFLGAIHAAADITPTFRMLLAYGITGRPATLQTVSFTCSKATTTFASLRGIATAYTGVSSIGTAVLEQGTETGTTESISVSSATNHMAVGAMATFNLADTIGSGFAPTFRQCHSNTLVMGDGPGASTVTFTCNRVSGSDYAEFAVDLIP